MCKHKFDIVVDYDWRDDVDSEGNHQGYNCEVRYECSKCGEHRTFAGYETIESFDSWLERYEGQKNSFLK